MGIEIPTSEPLFINLVALFVATLYFLVVTPQRYKIAIKNNEDTFISLTVSFCSSIVIYFFIDFISKLN